MVAQTNLRINQKIQIALKDRKEWFKSSIQDIRENLISIGMPYLQERPLVLHTGDEVRVRFAIKSASYIFNSRVIGEVKDNIILYHLTYPTEIKRIQQRSYVRIPVLLDVEYAMPNQAAAKPCKAVTVNLSGGGMKLAVKEKVEENTRLLLKFTLPLQKKAEPVELSARVIRAEKVDPGKKLYHLGLAFENINHRQEDMIVRFIFEKTAQQKRLL